MRLIYTLIWIIALPCALARLFWRSRSGAGSLEDLPQRLGLFAPGPLRTTLWIHAVSVGETRAAQPLIAALRQHFPDVRIVLTQNTATGRATARELYGSEVDTIWLPWDLPWAQRSLLRHLRPAVGLLIETELWPNLLAECARAGVPVALINARLSERSARGYGRIPALTRPMLNTLAVVAAQTAADAMRLQALGADSAVVCGNLKFDVALPEALRALGLGWRAKLGGRPVVLLASTRDGEEALLLPALHAALPPEALIALVPRHPQRFDEVAALVTRNGLPMIRRSADILPETSIRVWLGDSMGEMAAWYALANLALIGGSWLPLGGQNLIEACASGCPVIVGPHTFNFAQAASDSIAAGAAQRARDVGDAAGQTAALLASPARQAAMAEAGIAFAQSHRGATARTLALIEPLIQARLTATSER
ncbi:lipid IV(A) 3-deoxy-D-manno-octulosonic acid transferase [Methyloversatilis sp. NSM2]|uniref:lipid IV(A) 3-deoxy-D-manno-octulosonic acid transferase n=1 Tax=Methyloversatilis sp. NSM2 TaxID=3134135 RepID=UPI003116D448